MERGLSRVSNSMTNIQVRAAVKAQKAEARKHLLTYRGVSYLKQEPTWAPERVSV